MQWLLGTVTAAQRDTLNLGAEQEPPLQGQASS